MRLRRRRAVVPPMRHDAAQSQDLPLLGGPQRFGVAVLSGEEEVDLAVVDDVDAERIVALAEEDAARAVALQRLVLG